MIDLYALTSPNVQKIYVMLEETKLPYKEHFVDVWQGEAPLRSSREPAGSILAPYSTPPFERNWFSADFTGRRC